MSQADPHQNPESSDSDSDSDSEDEDKQQQQQDQELQKFQLFGQNKSNFKLGASPENYELKTQKVFGKNVEVWARSPKKQKKKRLLSAGGLGSGPSVDVGDAPLPLRPDNSELDVYSLCKNGSNVFLCIMIFVLLALFLQY